MFEETSLKKDILETLLKMPANTDMSVGEIAAQTKHDLSTIYKYTRAMENVGLVRITRWGKEKRVCLLRRGDIEELLSFFKTCEKLGLTEIDIKILETGEEDAALIAQKMGFLLNIEVIRRHKENILKRTCFETLAEARMEVFGKIRTPA